MSNGDHTNGHIVQIIGVVVDVAFPEGHLPEIFNALEIPRDDDTAITLEVEQHLGEDRVRTVSMNATDGLTRGMTVTDTGAPISVPVGQAALGRIMNVTGDPIDGQGPIEAEVRLPIHQPAPPLSELATHDEMLETGIK
ncbi:MAG: F0F1 ATP synthase subunit beta, partial [Candidatus Poribacteria bacterium]